jgi:hypothetical protein
MMSADVVDTRGVDYTGVENEGFGGEMPTGRVFAVTFVEAAEK